MRRSPARKAYAADWTRFERWCRERATPALPAPLALVAVYLSALASGGLAPPSIARALATIAHHHKQARLVPPHRTDGGSVVTDVLAGIRRSRVGGPDRKSVADADVVMQLLWCIEGDGMAALRDRALIAFGMATAARRSELVALDVADLAWEDKGLRVTIRRSKTDQEFARLGKPPGPMLDDYGQRVADKQAWVLVDDGGPAGVLILEDGSGGLLLDNLGCPPGQPGTGIRASTDRLCRTGGTSSP